MKKKFSIDVIIAAAIWTPGAAADLKNRIGHIARPGDGGGGC